MQVVRLDVANSRCRTRDFSTSRVVLKRASENYFKSSRNRLRSQIKNQAHARNGTKQANQVTGNTSKEPPLLLTAGNKRPLYNPAGGSTHYYADFQHSIHELDDAMKWRGYSVLRILFGLATLGTFYVYAFREEIKETASDVAADITSRTIENDELIEKAGALSQSVVLQVLTDSGTLEKSTEFITSLSGREDVKASIVALLTLVLNDPASIAKVKELLGAVVTQLLADPELKQVFVDFAYWLITQESTSKALSQLLAKTYKDPWFQETTNEFFGWVIASEPVYVSSQRLAQNSMQATLADPGFQEMTAVFFRDVLADQNLHEQGGNAMWEAFKFSLPGSGLFRRRAVPVDGSGTQPMDEEIEIYAENTTTQTDNSESAYESSGTMGGGGGTPTETQVDQRPAEKVRQKSDRNTTGREGIDSQSDKYDTARTTPAPAESAVDEGYVTDTAEDPRVSEGYRSLRKKTTSQSGVGQPAFESEVSPELAERRLRHDSVLPPRAKGETPRSGDASEANRVHTHGGTEVLAEDQDQAGSRGGSGSELKRTTQERTTLEGTSESESVDAGGALGSEAQADRVALDKQIGVVNTEIGRKIEGMATSDDESSGDGNGTHVGLSVGRPGGVGEGVSGKRTSETRASSGRTATEGVKDESSVSVHGAQRDQTTESGKLFDRERVVYDNTTKATAGEAQSASRGAMLDRINQRVRAQKDSFVEDLHTTTTTTSPRRRRTNSAHIESLADSLDEFHPVYDEHVMGGVLKGSVRRGSGFRQTIGGAVRDRTELQPTTPPSEEGTESNGSGETLDSIQRGVRATMEDVGGLHNVNEGEGGGRDAEINTQKDSDTTTTEHTTHSDGYIVENTSGQSVADTSVDVRETDAPVHAEDHLTPETESSPTRTSRFWGWWRGGSSDTPTDQPTTTEPAPEKKVQDRSQYTGQDSSADPLEKALDVPSSSSELSPRTKSPVPRK